MSETPSFPRDKPKWFRLCIHLRVASNTSPDICSKKMADLSLEG